MLDDDINLNTSTRQEQNGYKIFNQNPNSSKFTNHFDIGPVLIPFLSAMQPQKVLNIRFDFIFQFIDLGHTALQTLAIVIFLDQFLL